MNDDCGGGASPLTFEAALPRLQTTAPKLKRSYASEDERRAALNSLMSERQKRQIEKLAETYQKLLTQATGFVGLLNKPGRPTLPLTEDENRFRAASMSGDFLAMNDMAPFGKTAWLPKTPIGKYRFEVKNGRIVYKAFTDADFDRFMLGPWFTRGSIRGLAPLVHPRRTRKADMPRKLQEYKKQQEKSASQYPAADPRHVAQIYPGQYQIELGKRSTWVKIRKPVIAAVAIVAAVYLGPAVLSKIKGATATGGASGSAGSTGFVGAGAKGAAVKATGSVATGGIATGGAVTGGAVTQSASLFKTVQAGTGKLLGYVNKARTIKAIANGEIPPPPISIVGSSFTDWAVQVAKAELAKEAKSRAIELGQEYVVRQITKKEEAKLRREIEAIQRELNKVIPRNIPSEPNVGVPAIVQEQSAKLAIKENQGQTATVAILAIAASAFLATR